MSAATITSSRGRRRLSKSSNATMHDLNITPLIENAAILGDYMMRELAKLPAVKEVRGLGLMVGVVFDFNVAALRKSLVFEEHCFVGSSSEPTTVRLLPPLSITRRDVDLLVEKMRSALVKILEKEAVAV